MILSKRVALNGAQLDEVDGSIVIRRVDTGTTSETLNAEAMMGGSGQRITGQHWDMLEVGVSFAIDIPKKQLTARKAVFDQVVAWAMQKGWLTVNWMPGKRMYAEKVIIPSGGDMFEWTNEYTIVFRAYAVPFWQDDTATEAANGSITVPGNVETVCDAEIENGSGSTIDTLSISAGGSSMSFTGLGLADGETLIIDHGEDGLLHIRIYNGAVFRSAMGKRTGGSSDDLYVMPGANAVTVTGGNGSATVSCYGRYV